MVEALHTAAVEFRHIIFSTETGEQGIDNYEVGQLPDGALAFCAGTGVGYRLRKNLSGSTIAGAQVAARGGGLWVPESSTGASQYAYWMHSNAPETASTSTNWGQLGAAANRYVGIGSNAFSVNTTTGVVTYNGASNFSALVTVQLSMRPTTADKVFQVSISLNGELIGTASSPTIQAIQTILNGALGTLVTFRMFTAIESGDTLQPILKVGATTDSTDVEAANMMIQPAGL